MQPYADFPLLTAEIDKVPEDRRIGPMVIDEQTGRPYRHRWFAAVWRKIARKAGIPRRRLVPRHQGRGDH